jgi:TRAP-type C4-dicarboxylate transport system permease large subunit
MARLAVPRCSRQATTRGSRPARCASGGTLDALIPPSILFVIYGVFAEVSVDQAVDRRHHPGHLTATPT